MTSTAIALVPDRENKHNLNEIIKNIQLPTLNIQAVSLRAQKMLKDYCLHYGQVRDIQQADTGVIIGLIVYFIAREPKINRTKLEAYILLLNIICCKAYNKAFIDCTLTSAGRIGCFTNLMNAMEFNELISPRKHNTYPLCTKASWIIANSSKIFAGIEPSLHFILDTWGHKNGKQTLETALFLMGFTPNADDNVIDVDILDKNE